MPGGSFRSRWRSCRPRRSCGERSPHPARPRAASWDHREALDRVRAHRGHDLPSVLPRDLLPALRAVEDHLPTRILLQDDAGERLDDQGGLDAVGLQLCARDSEVGVDDGDILAELDALCIGIDLDHLKLRSPHIGRELLTFEVGERLDVGVPGKDDDGKREAGAKNQQDAFPELKIVGPPINASGLAGGERGVEGGNGRMPLISTRSCLASKPRAFMIFRRSD